LKHWSPDVLFFQLKTVEEVLRIIEKLPAVEDSVTIPSTSARGRVTAVDVLSPESLPGFSRSSMDGFAVRAKDTYGATESLPALLELAGEVSMGALAAQPVGPGQAVRISTGGMLPAGADAVVMVEYCHVLDESSVEVARSVSPLENVIGPEDDVRPGDPVIRAGTRLRPQEVGALAGLGISTVPVVRPPVVAVLSTGDEVVPMDRAPGPGQVRDINTHTLSAFCAALGAEPLSLGLVPDRFDGLVESVRRGLKEADSLWISGGSSVGTRDLTIRALESVEGVEVLVHGVSVSPGKPTIMARRGHRTVWGLPGHVASALVVAEVLLRPFLRRISGERPPSFSAGPHVEAELARNIESSPGRDDFIRVRLSEENGRLVADPLFGKSGLISPLIEADGLVRVDRFTEGLYQGERVVVRLFGG
jgi:molybdopterin molybdotransferase